MIIFCVHLVDPPKSNYSFILNIENRRQTPLQLSWSENGEEKIRSVAPLSLTKERFSFYDVKAPPPVVIKIVDPATGQAQVIDGLDAFTYQPSLRQPEELLIIPSKS